MKALYIFVDLKKKRKTVAKMSKTEEKQGQGPIEKVQGKEEVNSAEETMHPKEEHIENKEKEEDQKDNRLRMGDYLKNVENESKKFKIKKVEENQKEKKVVIPKKVEEDKKSPNTAETLKKGPQKTREEQNSPEVRVSHEHQLPVFSKPEQSQEQQHSGGAQENLDKSVASFVSLNSQTEGDDEEKEN